MHPHTGICWSRPILCPYCSYTYSPGILPSYCPPFTLKIALTWKITNVVILAEGPHCHLASSWQSMATFSSKCNSQPWDPLISTCSPISWGHWKIWLLSHFIPLHSKARGHYISRSGPLLALKPPCSHLHFLESLNFCQTSTSQCSKLKGLQVPSFLIPNPLEHMGANWDVPLSEAL